MPVRSAGRGGGDHRAQTASADPAGVRRCRRHNSARQVVSRAVLSIGSNVGDRRATLQSAVDAFRPWLTAISPVYETPPWGPVAQDDYLNAVLIVTDEAAGPRDWLERARS